MATSARYITVKLPTGRTERFDMNNIRCSEKTRQGKTCGAHPSERGELIITAGMFGGDFKVSGLCGNHVNREQGDNHRDRAQDVPAR